MKKKIGIDGSALYQPLTGMGTYLFYHLLVLLEMHPEIHFFLYYGKKSPYIQQLSPYPNLTLRQGKWFAKRNGVWSQTTLAYMSYQDRLDCFWGSNLSLPLWKRKKQKNLLTLHDFVYLLYPSTVSRKRRIYMKLLQGWMIRKADLLHCNSHGTKKKLQLYYQREAVVVEPPLKPCFRSFSKEEVMSHLDKYALSYKGYIVMLGTVEPRKRILPTLQIYAKANHFLMPLVIIGYKGWYSEREHERVKQLVGRSKNKILLLGFLSDEEVAPLLAGACSLLMPSYYEGYGMGIKEARSIGVPVICTDSEEMREAAEGDAFFLRETHFEEDLFFGLERCKSFSKGIQSQYASNQELAKRLSYALFE